nr:F0F1 ATP synthase subunit A [Anaerolineae bacterium]
MKGLLRFLLILVVAGLICGLPMYLLNVAQIPVAFPHVQVPAEALTSAPLFTLAGQPFHITNTMITTLIADIVLLLMAVVAGRAALRRLRGYEQNKKAVDEEGNDLLVPKGWGNTFETLLEFFYNLVEQVIGTKRLRQVFPIVATIFLFVLVANWLHFLPGVDSVGLLHCADAEEGLKGFGAAPLFGNVWRLDFAGNEISRIGEPSQVDCDILHAMHEEHGHETADAEIDESGIRYVITPFLRTATTDLNLTLAIAIVAMVAVQYFGLSELGAPYLTKFFNIPALEKGGMGYIFFAAGFIEIISEFAKIISFGLRLFGNLFAGTILLFVMAFLIPVGVPIIFYALEVFVGLIQAFVFAMLTLVFISSAMVGHGDDHH